MIGDDAISTTTISTIDHDNKDDALDGAVLEALTDDATENVCEAFNT
jgi:hypothetical protein